MCDYYISLESSVLTKEDHCEKKINTLNKLDKRLLWLFTRQEIIKDQLLYFKTQVYRRPYLFSKTLRDNKQSDNTTSIKIISRFSNVQTVSAHQAKKHSLWWQERINQSASWQPFCIMTAVFLGAVAHSEIGLESLVCRVESPCAMGKVSLGSIEH